MCNVNGPRLTRANPFTQPLAVALALIRIKPDAYPRLNGP